MQHYLKRKGQPWGDEVAGGETRSAGLWRDHLQPFSPLPSTHLNGSTKWGANSQGQLRGLEGYNLERVWEFQQH